MKIKIQNLNEIFINLQNNEKDFVKNHVETNLRHNKFNNNIQFTLNKSVFNKNYCSFCCFIENNNFEILKNISSYQIVELDSNNFKIEQNNNHICYLKYQNNFGIYIFNGRPDLYLKTQPETFLNLENINSFKESFNNSVYFIELFLNLIYKNDNNTIIELNFPSSQFIAETKQDNSEKQIPEALKRFYKRIGHK